MKRLPCSCRLAPLLAALLVVHAVGGEPDSRALIELARSGALAARIEAFEKIAGSRDENGIPALREAAAAGEAEIRVAAIASLGEFARQEEFPLLGGLAAEKDSRIAGAAVRALGRGGFKALPHLIDALRHEAAGVREAAGAAMQRVSGVRAEPALLAEACVASKGDRFAFLAAILARDAGPRASADALRALPDAPQSVPPLVKALGVEFEPVRVVARGRLEALACRRMDDVAWREWAKSPGTVVAWRAAAYSDPANPLRAAAARALAVPDAEAVAALAGCEAEGVAEQEALTSLATATGLRPRTRKEWSTWWVANRDRSRTEWLLAALLETGDAPNRAAAARALGGVRERRVVEHLMAYGAKDADDVVRGAVEHSLVMLVGGRQTSSEEWGVVWKRVETGWK